MTNDSTPLVPAEVDLTDFPFMPIMIARLKQSRAWLVCKRKPELAFYMINLWTASWHGKPAGSIEDDDLVLARAADAHPLRWRKIKALVLTGFVLCADGRWYHVDSVDRVMAAWAAKQKLRRKIQRRLEIESREWEQIRSAVFARDGFTCQYCGAFAGRLECDHVIPVSRGGETSDTNLVTACKPCNRSKGTKLLSEWCQ